MGKKFLFTAQQMGWDEKVDCVWFDEEEDDVHSPEEAFSKFEKETKYTVKNNNEYPYTRYSLGDTKYYSVNYRTTLDDGVLPGNIVVDRDHIKV